MRTGRPLGPSRPPSPWTSRSRARRQPRVDPSERARAHVQQLRHDHGRHSHRIGTVLADDCLLNDRTGLARSPPAAGAVMDSNCGCRPIRRWPQRGGRCGGSGHFRQPPPTPQAARRPRHPGADLDDRGGGPTCKSVVDWLGRQRYLSLMIEAAEGHWTALESGLVDRIFFYYRAQDPGGLEAASAGRRSGAAPAADAIRIRALLFTRFRRTKFAWKDTVDVHPGSLKSWARWNPPDAPSRCGVPQS